MTMITTQGQVATAAPTEAPQAPTDQAAAAPQVTKEELLSPKFAALARQQKEIRRQQLELKTREEALKAKETEYSTSYIPKSKFKADPFAVLTEEGISYDQIVNAAMSQDPQSQAMRKLEMEMQSIRDAQAKSVEEAKTQQQRAYEQAVNQVRNEVKGLVDRDATYEAIKANDAHEAVVELIKNTFEQTQELLTVEDAATQVEEYLLEQAMKLASLEKVKQRLAPKVEATPGTVPAQAQSIVQKPQGKTLTNAQTVVPSKPMSAKERRERAIAAFRGQLT